MTRDRNWHAREAERLLEQAERIAEELDLSWPEIRCKFEQLLQRAEVHCHLAALLPESKQEAVYDGETGEWL